jgi:phosphatidylinositol alpha-mannosyltransferase
MKIALVSPYDYAYPGGVTTHVSCLAREFSHQGHQVKILAPCSNSSSLRDNGDIVVLGRTIPVPSGGSIARINFSLWLLPRLRTILAEEGFDIIHLHEPSTPLLPWAVLCLSQTTNIGTFHAYHGDSRGYRFARSLLKKLFDRLDGRIAVSPPAKDFVARYFPGDYRIIPNGVDLHHFSNPAPPLEEFQDGKVNILFVGRLEKRKGLDNLLCAYSKVKKEFPRSRLLVVGPGKRLRRSYEHLVREQGIKDVVFAGYVPYAELPRYYWTADILCAPATGMESFGIVLLEAMAASRPLIASNIEGYASVISHGEEGLLVPPQDKEALYQALVSLVKDEGLRQQMGMRGRAKVVRYSWTQVAQEVMDYYLELLNRPRRLHSKRIFWGFGE